MGRWKNPLGKGKFRNNICICGSGKKVKKCHGKDESINTDMLNEINRMLDKANADYKKALEEAGDGQ